MLFHLRGVGISHYNILYNTITCYNIRVLKNVLHSTHDILLMIYYFAYNTYNFVLGTSAEREKAQWEQPQFREQAQFRNKCRKGTSNERGQAKGTSAGYKCSGNKRDQDVE